MIHKVYGDDLRHAMKEGDIIKAKKLFIEELTALTDQFEKVTETHVHVIAFWSLEFAEEFYSKLTDLIESSEQIAAEPEVSDG